ncbi:MAG TPA: glycerophosphodiester phosphodiesterase family protein, partial [Gemmatales bacterium]|nr:glycerophosphodiester phosphodiesterase family protein [Gemmatales bacterium]
MSYFADIVQYVRLAWKDFLVNQRQLFLTLYCLKLLELWLLMPLISMGLSFILSRSGYIAISNIDIFEFILTPIGLVYLLCSGAVTVTLAAFDQAIVHRIAENQKSPAPRGLLALFFSVLRKTGAFFEMSILKLVALTFVLLPFIFLGYVTYTVFLAEQDINYYIKRRPPEYWYALILGAVVLTVAVMTTLFLLARLSLALPILLYEKERVWSALRKSNQRVRGHTWQVALCLVGWLIVAFILGFLLELAFSYGAAALLKFAGERPVALMLLLLLVQALLVSKWSIVTLVGLGLLARQMYLKLGGTTEAREHTLPDSAVSSPPVDQFLPTARKYLGHRASMILVFLVVAPIGLWFTIAQLAAEPAPVQVTAHRGHAKAAPENTVSAIRKAIESGADFAEIDVLQTADGVVVLHHDRDLKRVSGDPRRVREVPYSELRQLDAGGWFSPAFSGEPIPTLAEVMQVAKGRIQ